MRRVLLLALIQVVVYAWLAWLVSFLLLPTNVELESGNIRLTWAIAGACLGVIVFIPFEIEERTIQNISALQRISDECRLLRRQVEALQGNEGPWTGPSIEPVVTAIRNAGTDLTIAAMVGAVVSGSVLAKLAPGLLNLSIGAVLGSLAMLLVFSRVTSISWRRVRDILRDRQREAAALRQELQSRCDKALASSVESSARRAALP
jgi:hypothetical protein